MANYRFILQQPYKKSENSDPAKAKLENQEIRIEVSRRKRSKKDFTAYLNPKRTRVYLWVIQDRENKAKIKTDFTIYPKDWDFTGQKAKKSMPGSTEYNEKLSKLETNTETHYNALQRENPGISFSEISEALKKLVNENFKPAPIQNTFFAVFDNFIEAEKQIKSIRTIQKFQTLKKSLEDFTSILYPKSFSFNNVDLKFYDEYTNYLRNLKPRGRQKNRPEELQTGLLDDTISKYISSLKAFMRWSLQRNYHQNSTFTQREFKASRNSETSIITLTPEELKQLYHFDFSNNERLEKVRDLFCFGCFTGQRWSDMETFNKNDIKGDAWTFKSFKTKKVITVPLVGFIAPALDILRKYNYQLPKISPQKFNKYIKEAAEVARINANDKIVRKIGSREITIEKPKFKFISSHTARRTCVSILLNYEYLPITLVKEITGHTRLETLQKYIKDDKEALRKALEKSNNYNEI